MRILLCGTSINVDMTMQSKFLRGFCPLIQTTIKGSDIYCRSVGLKRVNYRKLLFIAAGIQVILLLKFSIRKHWRLCESDGTGMREQHCKIA